MHAIGAIINSVLVWCPAECRMSARQEIVLTVPAELVKSSNGLGIDMGMEQGSQPHIQLNYCFIAV